MKQELNRNQVGLTVGIFFAALHAIWALLIELNLGQSVIDWVFPLHFINSIYTVTDFSLANAAMLVIMAFATSYIMGWLFAALYNWVAIKVK